MDMLICVSQIARMHASNELLAQSTRGWRLFCNCCKFHNYYNGCPAADAAFATIRMHAVSRGPTSLLPPQRVRKFDVTQSLARIHAQTCTSAPHGHHHQRFCHMPTAAAASSPVARAQWRAPPPLNRRRCLPPPRAH
eukprot:1640177-Pleurochrysis_carterae.AAC.1